MFSMAPQCQVWRKTCPALRDKVHPVSPAPEGYVWISEECKHGKKWGEELEVSPGFGVSIDRSVAQICWKKHFD